MLHLKLESKGFCRYVAAMHRILAVALSLVIASPAAGDVGRCPISADFIADPEIIETSVPLAGVEVLSTTHRSFVRGAMVSIECTEIDPDSVFPGASEEQILRNYLRFWSIEPLSDATEGLSSGQSPVSHIVMTGTKTIQYIEVTYSYRLFRFPSSFALVAVGMPSDTIDTADVERFLSSIQIAGQDTETGDLELFEIVRDGHISDLRQALQRGTWSEADLSKALVAAAGLNRPAEAQLLLEAGADPNHEVMGSSVIVTATRENSVAVLELLLRNGADPNRRAMFEWSPLHHAILPDGSRYQALQAFIQAGSDLDARTSLQVTPLHRAAGFCDRRTVEMLLDAGADPSLTEQYGRTAYQRSVEAGCSGVGGLRPN